MINLKFGVRSNEFGEIVSKTFPDDFVKSRLIPRNEKKTSLQCFLDDLKLLDSPVKSGNDDHQSCSALINFIYLRFSKKLRTPNC